ncbi:DMT family transporter [Candidatus Woesearchaeota archaeon]|nr:DMT family transporter [Candidatus Woesearchaeota archaeon]
MATAKSGYFYLVLTILFWSTTPALAKLALKELTNSQLLLYTILTGVLILFLVNLFMGKLRILSNYSKVDYLKMFGMGFLGIYLYNSLLYGSFALAPAGQANVINYLWPIFIIVFSIVILKERFNYKTVIAILLGFLGALIVFSGGNLSAFNGESVTGYLLAAIGAVCFALFSVLGKKLKYEKFTSMLAYYVAAAVLIVPTVLITSGVVVPISFSTVIAILMLGGVNNSLAFIFWFQALKLGNTHKTANAVYAVPFLALFWTYILNGEHFSLTSIIGLVCIVAGIFLQVRNKA